MDPQEVGSELAYLRHSKRNRLYVGNQNDDVSHLKRHVRLSGVQLMVPHVIIVGGGFGGISAARALGGAAVRVGSTRFT